VSALPGDADRPATVIATISHVATALTGDNATDAMVPFDKSFPDYAKLRDYFSGLTNSSQLVNEIDVTDKKDSGTESNITVAWTLTLTNRTTLQTERRSSGIHVRLKLQDGKWKILDLSPIDFFNPQSKQHPR
jgi:hypothetical protein